MPRAEATKADEHNEDTGVKMVGSRRFWVEVSCDGGGTWETLLADLPQGYISFHSAEKAYKREVETAANRYSVRLVEVEHRALRCNLCTPVTKDEGEQE